MSFGVDYAWSRPTILAMKAAGVEFVCRYLSHDTTGKNITIAEARALRDAGMSLVLVWETTASRALAGERAGRDDALSAVFMARALGFPEDRPLFFAVDFDATAEQQPQISAYFAGVASVIGRSRVGMYGGHGPVSRAFDAGVIAYGWQTYAWSAGRWDKRAGLQQYANGERIGGQEVDFNRSTTNDYGQWPVGETSMAFTADDKKWMIDVLVPAVAKAVWLTDGLVKNADGSATNTHWTPAFHLESAGKILRQLTTAVANVSLMDEVTRSAIVADVLNGLSPETIAAAIATHLGPEVAAATADALSKRLES